MFQKTLGLSDDPFNPTNFPPAENLAVAPLRVDEQPKLEALLCWDIGGFGEHKAEIERIIYGPLGQTSGAAQRSGIIAIVGGKGTGKSTLARYIKRRVTEAAAAGAAWREYVERLPDSRDLTQQSFASRFTALRSKLDGELAKTGERVLLVLDDLPERSFASVTELYMDLERHRRIFVVTTTDSSLTQKELDWSGGARVRVIETRNVNIDEAKAYVVARTKLYRDPARPEFERVSPTFPWAPSALKRHLGDAPGATQPVRVLNCNLSRDVNSYHANREHDQAVDMQTADEARLGQLMIP